MIIALSGSRSWSARSDAAARPLDLCTHGPYGLLVSHRLAGGRGSGRLRSAVVRGCRDRERNEQRSRASDAARDAAQRAIAHRLIIRSASASGTDRGSKAANLCTPIA